MQRCRFCGEILTQSFVDLGMSPLSNSFIKLEDLYTAETFCLCMHLCAINAISCS